MFFMPYYLILGTSTKYDYLSTYTNIGSKYETKYNTSSSYAKVKLLITTMLQSANRIDILQI